MLDKIMRQEKSVEIALENWMRHHVVSAFFIALLGMPILMILAVFAFAAVTIFPFAWMGGWL